MGRRRKRHKQLLNDLVEKRTQWQLKEQTLVHTLWRTSFGRDYGPAL